MPVTVVLPALFPTALLNDTTKPAPPTARDGSVPTPRPSDVVVFSTPPFRALAELAAAGLRSLAVLLPSLELAVEDHALEPLAHLVKAATTAVRQVSDGHVALLAEGPDRLAAALPSTAPPRASAPAETPQQLRNLARQIGATLEPMTDPAPSDTLRTVARQIGAATLERPLLTLSDPKAEPAQRWLAEADHILHRAGDTLDQASALVPLAETALTQPTLNPLALEIAAAQMQVATTRAALSSRATAPRQAPTPSRFPLDLLPRQLSNATSLIGTLVILALMSLATGLWSVCLVLLGLGATIYWVWRIGRAAQGVSLDATR